MKVWEEFNTISQFKQSAAATRNCTKDCESCKTLLTRSGTRFVHMIVNAAGKTRFICDKCLSKLKEHEDIRD
jgi:hypothetical protein